MFCSTLSLTKNKFSWFRSFPIQVSEFVHITGNCHPEASLRCALLAIKKDLSVFVSVYRWSYMEWCDSHWRVMTL